jgi:hypothetical protein
MLPPGHSAGALTKEMALSLIEEGLNTRNESDRYRQAIDQLRLNVVAARDPRPGM